MARSTKQVNLRLTEEQRAELDRRAEAAGLELTSYLLGAALGPEAQDRALAYAAARADHARLQRKVAQALRLLKRAGDHLLSTIPLE